MIRERQTITPNKNQHGQGLVEFALILPLLLVLIWGVIEFGRLLVIYTEVSNASREAVRYGVARGTDISGDPRHLDCEGIREAGTAVTGVTAIAPDDIQIAYDHGGDAIFATCDQQPANVSFGDRLVITVTHSVRPLILFQNAGPFNVQFTTARTIVEEGIPLSEGIGGGGDADGPPGEGPNTQITVDDSSTCSVYFAWDSVEGATGYHLYQSVPTPTTQINGDILGLRYPETGGMSVSNNDEYFVRAYNDEGDGPASSTFIISGCLSIPQNFVVVLDDSDTCQGHFEWDTLDFAAGYHLYESGLGQINGDIAGTRYPSSGSTALVNLQTYTLNGYNGLGEGPSSVPVTVSGCGAGSPPDAPTNLTFVLDQGNPPCQGHFEWDAVIGASSYRLYQGANLVGEVGTERYPDVGQMNVANDDRYSVTALNASGESAASYEVPVGGCSAGSGPVSLTYYLHSDPTPPNWHGAAPPPLTMNDTAPARATLYNYNDTDPSKPGRLVSKGGGTPPGETDTAKYLEWRSDVLAQNLELQSDVTLHMWGKNPANQIIVATAYLYEYDGANYQLISQGTYSWGKNISAWQLSQITLSGGSHTLSAGNQLVVWLISDNSKSLQFAYDTTNENSRIEFTGEWLP